ncbi:MAG: glycosyltransferase family 2 protein [Phycisphaeraceae bacterium]|nr:glycosyltransferase family 2 protein [Phycisphaeraceae bacterium]
MNEATEPSHRLRVIIVNFRTPELTVDCLRSLADQRPVGADVRVSVVDNGSGDDSVRWIQAAVEREGWAGWVEPLPLEKNLGFAAGNNHAIRQDREAFAYLLLNSDTRVGAGCLSHGLKRMIEEPDIGALSPKAVNEDGSAQAMARRFPTPIRTVLGALGLPGRLPWLLGWADVEDASWDRQTTRRDVDWLGGTCLFVRREAIDRVGMLDEDFFFYGEDVEFCHRLRRAGYRCHYDPETAVTHLGGGSSDPERMSQELRNVHRWRARYLVQRKCYGRWAEALVKGADLLTSGLRMVFWACLGQRKGRQYRNASTVWCWLRGGGV